MLKKVFSACITLSACVCTTAQDSTSKSSGPTITGSVDAYYRYNFANPTPAGGNVITDVNNFTSFTNSHNSFELGMASVKAEHSLGKASATLDLGFGKRAEEFAYGDAGNPTLFAVKQAYVSYAVSEKIKLSLGKWATHVGYELADAYLNRNYSMSYMFSYGPFSHTGVKADITLSGKNAIMVGVANMTDIVSTTSSRKFALAQYSTGSGDDKFKAYVNYQGSFGGSFDVNQFDVVLTQAVTDQFSIGYNGTVQSVKTKPKNANSSSANWWGSALYFNYDPTSVFGITLRGEYFDNKKGVSAAPATSIFDITLSPNFKTGNLTIIPELRLDNAKSAIFVKNDGTATKSTVSAILAVMYSF